MFSGLKTTALFSGTQPRSVLSARIQLYLSAYIFHNPITEKISEMGNTDSAPTISSSYVEGNLFNRESLPSGNLAGKRTRAQYY